MSYTLSPLVSAVPAADANGYWHYTYSICDLDTGEWYGGKHSTRDLEDSYFGSGNWVAAHAAPGELLFEIIEFFTTETEAYAAEAELITWEMIDNDPLCRNETPGGLGMCSEFMRRLFTDPTHRQKNRDALARTRENPKCRAKQQVALEKARSNPETIKKHAAGLARRSENPVWIQNCETARTKLRNDVEYQEKRRAENIALASDPKWQQANREAVARRSNDSEWHKRNLEGAIKGKATRAADPDFGRKISEGKRRAAEARRLAARSS